MRKRGEGTHDGEIWKMVHIIGEKIGKWDTDVEKGGEDGICIKKREGKMGRNWERAGKMGHTSGLKV